MAYDEFMADRIRNILKEKKVAYSEKKMFGGMCFMIDDKMACGVHYDKKKATALLMARIEKPLLLPQWKEQAVIQWILLGDL